MIFLASSQTDHRGDAAKGKRAGHHIYQHDEPSLPSHATTTGRGGVVRKYTEQQTEKRGSNANGTKHRRPSFKALRVNANISKQLRAQIQRVWTRECREAGI